MANPHSPEELAALSTLVHQVIGWVLLLLASIQFTESLRGVSLSKWQYGMPGMAAVIGLGLSAYIFFHMMFYHQVSPFQDPQQVQHQLIGLTIGIGALIEGFRRSGRAFRHFLWEGAWPISITAVGVLFLIHEQGTTEALLVHWALAATLILAGLCPLSAILTRDSSKTWRVLGSFLLFAAAFQLILYQEKPGAHGEHGTAGALHQGH